MPTALMALSYASAHGSNGLGAYGSAHGSNGLGAYGSAHGSNGLGAIPVSTALMALTYASIYGADGLDLCQYQGIEGAGFFVKSSRKNKKREPESESPSS